MCNIRSVDEIQIRDITRCFVKRSTSPGYFMAQLYCYRCGEELDGEQEMREKPWGTVSHAFLECRNCHFWLTGQNALAEVEVAWQELWRAQRQGITNR